MPKLPSTQAIVTGVTVTVIALAVWELWGRDFVESLK